ncbi:ROK family protein [Dactylosporangium fulvum]|uniref:ROK family protein n=1 Tax=Dactylosporangium fulvum TaxID=53359 RepID=A0ABY5W4S9_9ACTN|nr:ROK family protein [Dactylosporangium fulvum]UWP84390.1 ROK family protein [Dactylosporangium fulvum]
MTGDHRRAWLGIDIGGTKILAAVVDADGRVVRHARVDTPAGDGPAGILDTAAALAAPLLPDAPDTTVGVGAAGTVDAASGRIRFATDILPGWCGTPVADELAARLRRRVRVENDANAAAVAEAWIGAGRERPGLFLVAIGTGIGAGLVRAGRLDRGATGLAGEIAHLPVAGAEHLRCVCGRFGHLEAIASGTGLAAAYTAATGTPATGRQVADRAVAGDPVARDVVATAGRALGRVLAGLAALLDPGAIAATGGAAPALLPAAGDAYTAELLPAWAGTPLLPGALPDTAVAVGAARLAMTQDLERES